MLWIVAAGVVVLVGCVPVFLALGVARNLDTEVNDG